jgi:ATP-dependent DNA ligase
LLFSQVLTSQVVPANNQLEDAFACFIEPGLHSPADKPPSGSNWIHETKDDGYCPSSEY